MQPYLTFALNHWALCLSFIIVLILFLGLELRTKFNGIAQLSPHEAILLINRDEGIVVDLRDHAQFNKGHILGAINIPANDLEQKVKQLAPHKNKTVILVQNTGQPTGKAAALLQNNGFINIKSLNGGMNAWLNANLPLAKG